MKYDRANVIVPLRKTLGYVSCILMNLDLIVEAYEGL
jgi:hypothetical protein